MFFVGATGQLVTLILTVCLPFVFLLSGKQAVEVQLPAKYLVVNQVQNEISSLEKNTVNYFTDIIKEDSKIHFEFKNTVLQTFPLQEYCVKWKSIYSKSSGNKAPPVHLNFFC